MRNDSLKEHVDLIREVFLYLRRFKGKTFVLKIDDPVIHSLAFPVIVQDLAQLQQVGIHIVVVAGARQRIDEVLRRYEVKNEMVGAQRISSPEAMPFIKMAAFDAANTVMTHLTANGVSAVIGNWVKARTLGVVNGIDFLNTGDVERVSVDPIRRILDEGIVPIFPCIGWNVSGEPYNVSSNKLAATLAKSLNADKLFFVTSRTPDQEAEGAASSRPMAARSKLTIREAEALLAKPDAHAGIGWQDGPEILNLAVETCRSGVQRVHVVEGLAEGSILREVFSNLGSGMMVYSNRHESIRAMTVDDIPGVLRIMKPYVEKGHLLTRDEEFMIKSHHEFHVYEIDGSIHGCGGLHLHEDGKGEIVGIAVDQTYMEMGIGRRIVEYLLELAKRMNLKDVFLLTTQAADWFAAMGFRTGTLRDLPPRKQEKYDHKRGARVLLLALDEVVIGE